MEGSVRILRRFVGATMVISILLLIINFILLGVLVFSGMNEGQSPSTVVERTAEGLRNSSGAYMLEPSAAELLKQNRAWAMLIDDAGHVIWEYELPDELPRVYSLADVSKFSRSYLMDYPVFVWEHEEGIVVVGYPKNSLAKYLYVLPTNWVSSLPLKIASLLAANIALGLLLSLIIGARLIRSIRPITQGIESLAEDREVYIEPKGVLANLAQSVNRVSALLQQKSNSLKARDEARSNWIAGISHDIRTPLSMVLGYASNLEENSELPIESRRQAGIIRQQAEKLRALVHDLNLVSMLEYEMQPLDRKPIRLSALARQIASDFLNQGLDERYELEIEELDETAVVHGDERLLTRAVSNLIQNSINHNPGGCRIELRISRQEGEHTCRLIVADNGKGMDPQDFPDLLELPYSSRRKQPRSNGHGLGLPMVARIAKAHQGQLILNSELGKGFRAEIMLPAIE